MDLRPQFRAGGAAQKLGLFRQLRDGSAEVYHQARRAPWTEMRYMRKHARASSDSNFSWGKLLFLNLKAADFGAAWNKLDGNAIHPHWQKAAAFLFCSDCDTPGERFPMKDQILFPLIMGDRETVPAKSHPSKQKRIRCRQARSEVISILANDNARRKFLFRSPSTFW